MYIDFNVQGVNVKAGRQFYKLPGDPFSLVLRGVGDGVTGSTEVGPATVYFAYFKADECDKDDEHCR